MLSIFKPPRKRPICSVSTSDEPISNPATKKLHSHLMTTNHELLTTGQYSDFTVFCGARKFHLHRSIVCPRSTFFATALEGSFVEAGTKVITLFEDDPAVVLQMFQFLYTSEYGESTHATVMHENRDGPSDDLPTEADEYECFASHVRVYAIADKYDIVDLKSLAKSKLQSLISGRWPIPFFPALIQGILNSTPPKDTGLRDIIIPICAEHVTELLTSETAISYSLDPASSIDPDPSIVDDTHDEITFKQTLSENGAFTSAILTQVVQNSSDQLKDSGAACAGLSQELATNKEKSMKEVDSLKEKLRQARQKVIELENAMKAAGRQPLCCEGAGFLPSFSPGNSRSSAQLRLKCAACRKVYN